MAEEQTYGVSPPVDSGGENGLTPIHGRIHCGATDVPGGGEDDLQKIDVRNFTDALAEIALAVALGRQDLEL